jgi:predicted nucleotide-binding protein (sugar kinase/HSP70/actin superfamily)
MSKSIEELLKLVQSRESTGRKAPEDNKSVMNFIQDMGIEAGTHAVPNYLIFYVYRRIWKLDQEKGKAKKITFFQTFGKHLPDYRHGKQRFYMIKEGIFDVNEEILKQAELYDRQYWGKKEAQKRISPSIEERVEDET